MKPSEFLKIIDCDETELGQELDKHFIDKAEVLKMIDEFRYDWQNIKFKDRKLSKNEIIEKGFKIKNKRGQREMKEPFSLRKKNVHEKESEVKKDDKKV